jgi:hypothetical protein
MGQQNRTFHAAEFLDGMNVGKPWPLKSTSASPEPKFSF